MNDSSTVQDVSPALPGPMNVWASNLSWVSLPALIATFFKHGRFVLHCTSESWGGGIVASILWSLRILRAKCLKVEFTLDAERVDIPDSRRLFIQGYFPNEFNDRFFAQNKKLMDRIKYPDSNVNRDRILVNLRKSLGDTTYQLMALAEFAFYWHRCHGQPIDRLVVLSPNAVLANTIPSGWHDRNIEFRATWSPRHSMLLQFMSGLITIFINAFRVRRKNVASPASVGVEHAWGLEPSARLNDLFWWWESGIPADRVVLFFDRADYHANRNTVAAAQSLGIRCAVIHPRAIGDSPQLLWRPSPGLKVSLIRLWRQCKAFQFGILRGRTTGWVACRILSMLRNSEEQEDFLTDFNIKAVFHYQDGSSDYLSLACDAVGGSRIGYHWSHFPWPEASVARIHQVYFVWGQYQLNMLEANYSVVDHTLLSGCIVNGASPGRPPNPDVIAQRMEIEKAGAERVLAIFDTSAVCDKFYEFFLTRVLEDSRWGLLIKPKSPRTGPSDQSQPAKLQTMYQEALAKGRVRELDSQLSPADAASGADLAVGIEIGSASVVAALAGYRSVYLDYAHTHQTPFNEWATLRHAAPDRLVFNDPEDLWRRLNAYFDDPHCDPELGLAGECVLHEIDPFRDGLAGERIGDFVRMYLDNLDNGLPVEEASSEASRHFTDKWQPATTSSKAGYRPMTPVGSDESNGADGPGFNTV